MNYIKIIALIIVLSYCSDLVAQDHNLYHQTNEINTMIFEEKEEMALSLSLMSSGQIEAYNIQMGYNVFKHLNLSAAFSREFGDRGDYTNDYTGKNTSYSFSVGTNYKFRWSDKVIFRRMFKKSNLRVEKGINFVLNVGYSINHLNTFGVNSNNIYSEKDIKYNSLFTKLGFSYDYNWGNWGLFGLVNFNNYKYLKFTGTWLQDGFSERVSNHFESNSHIRTWGFNFHNEMGRRMIKLIFGLNVIVTDSFGEVIIPISENSPKALVYLGTLIDLSKLGKLSKRKKRREEDDFDLDD